MDNEVLMDQIMDQIIFTCIGKERLYIVMKTNNQNVLKCQGSKQNIEYSKHMLIRYDLI